MPRKFEALCLAGGKGRYGLPQAQIIESNFRQRRQPQAHFFIRAEKRQRLGYCQVEDVGNALRRGTAAGYFNLENFGSIAAAIAIRASQVHIRKELHFDMLEAVAAASRTAAIACIETERTGGVFAFAGLRQAAEQIADGVKSPHVTCRI